MLVGGAGAGREMVALGKRGYQVLGFDPCAELVVAGRTAVDSIGGRLDVGTYDELIDYAARESSRFRSLLDGRAIDAIILGWGSICYVRSRAKRVRLLAACRHQHRRLHLAVFRSSIPAGGAWARYKRTDRDFLDGFVGNFGDRGKATPLRLASGTRRAADLLRG